MLLQAFFHKHHSEDSDASGSRPNKTKLSNIVVECRKVGEVVVLTQESLESSENQKWEKCKLALVKTVGGYLLEFYSPPNAKKVCVHEFFHQFQLFPYHFLFKRTYLLAKVLLKKNLFVNIFAQHFGFSIIL